MADQTSLAPQAEAAPRRKHITAQEFWAMIEAGVFQHIEDRVELIEGEIVELAPQSSPHYQTKNRIGRHFIRSETPNIRTFIEPTFTIGDTVVDPDIVVMPVDAADGDIEAGRSLLIVEVAVSSLPYDLKTKAAIYARAGVPEYWVIDVEKQMAIVHRAPLQDGSWREVLRLDSDAELRCASLPAPAFKLSDL